MIDKNIAQSATRALNRHLWYLTAEMVPLALFRHDVPETERRALVDALLDDKQPTVQTPLLVQCWLGKAEISFRYHQHENTAV